MAACVVGAGGEGVPEEEKGGLLFPLGKAFTPKRGEAGRIGATARWLGG